MLWKRNGEDYLCSPPILMVCYDNRKHIYDYFDNELVELDNTNISKYDASWCLQMLKRLGYDNDKVSTDGMNSISISKSRVIFSSSNDKHNIFLSGFPKLQYIKT